MSLLAGVLNTIIPILSPNVENSHKGFFLLWTSYIDQFSFNTLNKNLLKDCKLKELQTMKWVSVKGAFASMYVSFTWRKSVAMSLE